MANPRRLIQIDVTVNATESGTIKELLVNEEDTVTVGQDLAKLKPGAAPSGDKGEKGEKGGDGEKAKEPTPAPSPAEKPAEKKAEPAPRQEQPPKQKAAPEKAPEPATKTSTEQPVERGVAGQGTREERRVGV